MSERSIWERRPWTGALLFALLMIGVGWVLVKRIGEPKTEWRLRTVVPPPGTGLPGGPAIGVFEGDQNQVPKIYVTTWVQTAAGEGLRGVEAVLVRRDTNLAIARGITPPISGKVDLPVPMSAAQALVSEELDVLILDPAGPPTRLPVPRPKKGRTTVKAEMTPRASMSFRIVDARGLAMTGAARAFATEPGRQTSRLVRGVPAVQGGVVVGGLPRGRIMRITIEAEGHEPGELDVFVPPLGKKAPVHQLVLGPRQARIVGRLADAGTVEVGVRIEGDPFGRRPDVTVSPDAEGRFRVDVPPGEDLRLTFAPRRENTKGIQAVFTRWALGAGAEWDLGEVRLEEAPVLITGRVTDQKGEALPHAVVTTDAYRVAEGGLRPWVAWTTADASGAFVLRGPRPEGSLRVEARAGEVAGWFADPVSAGSKDLSIEVGEPAMLEGSLRGASPALRRAVAFELWLEGGRRPYRVTRALAPQYERFLFDDLPAGRYELVMRRPLMPAERVTEVDVGFGDQGQQGELSGLRMTAGFPWQESVLRLPSGAEAAGAELSIESLDPEEAAFVARADLVGRVRYPRPPAGRLLYCARLGRDVAFGPLADLGPEVSLKPLAGLAVKLLGRAPQGPAWLEAVPAEAERSLPRALLPAPLPVHPGAVVTWRDMVPGRWNLRLRSEAGVVDLGVVLVPDEGIIVLHERTLP